jgi:hypothetical protein
LVTEQTSSVVELHKWQRGHVWLLWRFRQFVELENKAAKAGDKGMKRHWWDKRSHISNKIQQLEQQALKHPTQILEELGLEKKDKPPPSSSGPIV